MNTLRIQVVKTDRTDLVCVHCGEFGARRPMLALVGPTVAAADAIAGVHVKCVRLIKASRRPPAPKSPGVPVPVVMDDDGVFVETGEFRTEPAPPPFACDEADDDEVPDGLV